MLKKSFPIIIGAAQYKQAKETILRLDPLNIMIKTSQMAIENTKIEDIKNYIDTVYVLNVKSWSYKDAPGELARNLGINPKTKVYFSDSGSYPQMLVNMGAKVIEAEEAQMVLITGAEAKYSIIQEVKGKVKLDWPKREKPKSVVGHIWEGMGKFENKYEIFIPTLSYALFETALRAASGRSIEEHKKFMGKLFEQFSKIAANHPYAWNQIAYTSEQIITPSPDNRMVSYPYTKRMCANMYVDMGGTVIMTSEKLAKELNINKNKWIYLMGGADFENIFEVTKRPNLNDSPAARKGSDIALKQAGLTINDINLFDLYSCFPSMVEILKNELELKDDDPRQLTITGGLPFFGGPWSVYSLHAIITAVDLIQKNNSLKIMVIANGGYNTKQSIGIYGNQRPLEYWSDRNDDSIQESILKEELPDPLEIANGTLKIEAYTITYYRKGQNRKGIALGTLKNGQRTLAYIELDSGDFSELEENELVGKEFPIYYDSEKERNFIKIIN